MKMKAMNLYPMTLISMDLGRFHMESTRFRPMKFADISRIFSGRFPDILRIFPGHFFLKKDINILRAFPGYFADISRTFEILRTFPGYFPDVSRTFCGYFPDIFPYGIGSIPYGIRSFPNGIRSISFGIRSIPYGFDLIILEVIGNSTKNSKNYADFRVKIFILHLFNCSDF